MAISVKTRKMLWGRAASRCAVSDCRAELVIDGTEKDQPSILGEECHIVARSGSAARGCSELPPEQRDDYDNLVLLCSVHHKLVDDQPEQYSVDSLRQIKADHEEWVRKSLESYDAEKQADDERYAEIIEKLFDKVNISCWQSWSQDILSNDHPSISLDMHDRLAAVGPLLLSCIWPDRHPKLRSSIENFRFVLQDLLKVFDQHSEEEGQDWLGTTRFYKSDGWDEDRYEDLLAAYESHVDLVQDLMLELTRATNYVCDQVRESFLPAFRQQEGALLVVTGPDTELKCSTLRPEYRNQERTEQPYPGLDEFRQVRHGRDFHFGREREQGVT